MYFPHYKAKIFHNSLLCYSTSEYQSTQRTHVFFFATHWILTRRVKLQLFRLNLKYTQLWWFIYLLIVVYFLQLNVERRARQNEEIVKTAIINRHKKKLGYSIWFFFYIYFKKCENSWRIARIYTLSASFLEICFEHAASVLLLHRRYFTRWYDANHRAVCTVM